MANEISREKRAFFTKGTLQQVRASAVMASLFVSFGIGAIFPSYSSTLLHGESQREEESSSRSLSLRGSIIVDNRVLASVRGQVITVYDLVKKLDMIFYRQFPEYRSSVEARLQFYKSHWKTVLKDSIDRQLALAYAEEKKFDVSRGDIREELEELFGPNVMMNLYDAGLNLYDVEEMLKADILMRRLLSYFVRTQVMASLTPQELRNEYFKRLESVRKEKKGDEEWVWQSFTIAPKSGDAASLTPETINKIHKDIIACGSDQEMSQVIAENDVEIAPSQPFTSLRSTISPHIVEAVENVPQGKLSTPLQIQSRASENNTVWKSYKLIEKKDSVVEEKPFREIEAELREEIAAPRIAQKTSEFFQDLRRQYGVHMMLSDKELEIFDPFHLSRAR